MLFDVRGQQENIWVLLFYTEGREGEKGASNQTSRPSRHPAVTRDSLWTQLPIGQEEAWKYLGGPTKAFKETRETQHEDWGEVSVEDSHHGKPALALEMQHEARWYR